MADKTLIIKRIKEAYNLRTSVEVARFLGVSAQVLSNWQNRNTVNYDTIFPKCQGINLNWLIYGEGDMFIERPLSLASEESVAYEKVKRGKGSRSKADDTSDVQKMKKSVRVAKPKARKG